MENKNWLERPLDSVFLFAEKIIFFIFRTIEGGEVARLDFFRKKLLF
jgi:hypothetical protein